MSDGDTAEVGHGDVPDRYMRKGETWHPIVDGKQCEDCGSRMSTNGTVRACLECDRWEVIPDA